MSSSAIDGPPAGLVARTIKGRGVSFMEHPAALRDGGGTYRWHAGAPDDESFERARDELLGADRRARWKLEPVPPARGRAACTGARGGAGEWRGDARHGQPRVRRRGLRRSARRAGRTESRRSSCSTPTSRPTAACAASRRRIRSASSSAASPSRTWCPSPAGWRATASYPSSTRSRASSPPARTSRSTTTRARARR